MPEIIIIDTRKPQETKAIHLTPETQINQECLVGRDGRCSIVLNDTMTSRIHGKIAFRNGKYFYSDLGSRNGTKINNETAKVDREYQLKPSDTIALGNHLLWVKAIATPDTPVALSPDFDCGQYMPLATIDTSKLQLWNSGTLNVKCMRIVDETAEVKTFTLIAEPPVIFSYQPGQYITVNVNIGGKKFQSPYSISSTPSRPHTLEITVKREVVPKNRPIATSGLVSNWLHDNLKVGSQILINAPTGELSNFAHPARKLLLMSADLGIAPMMSMSRWICDTASNVEIILLYFASSPQDIIYRSELEMMSARYPNFKLAISVTQLQPGQPWYGYTGKLNKSNLTAIAPDYQERTVFVCGSNSFLETAESILQQLGFPMHNYYRENLAKVKQPPGKPAKPPTPTLSEQDSHTPIIEPTAPPPKANPDPDQNYSKIMSPASPTPTSLVGLNNLEPPDSTKISFPTPTPPMVVLAKSGQEIYCDGKKSILELAENEGAVLPFGCRQGICHECQVKKIEGEVFYDDDYNCDEGYVLTCVAKPIGKVVIDV